MEKRRTVPVKLDVDSDDAALLRDTVDEFLWAANYVTRQAFHGEYVTTSKTTLHDDYNAAKNIGLRFLRRNQTGADGGAPVGVRLNNGTLNAMGEYEPPAEESARAGVHAESNPFRGGLAYYRALPAPDCTSDPAGRPPLP